MIDGPAAAGAARMAAARSSGLPALISIRGRAHHIALSGPAARTRSPSGHHAAPGHADARRAPRAVSPSLLAPAYRGRRFRCGGHTPGPGGRAGDLLARKPGSSGNPPWGGLPTRTPRTFVSDPSENERVDEVTSPNTCSAQGFLSGGVMPLPEHEQRQLQQIEQALYRDDPKFARLMRASDPRVHHARRLMQALPGAVIGASSRGRGGHPPCLPGRGRRGDRAAVPGAGGGQLAAVRGQGPACAFQGGDQDGDGHEEPARADQAGPDDGANGRALAPPPGG